MPPAKHSPLKSLLHLAETLAFAGLGGAMFGLSGFPAGWLSGSMLFSAIVALAGRPVGVPPSLARIIFVVIGISLGAVATPETLRGIVAWPLSIAVLAIAVIAVSIATASYLRLVHGWDTVSAFLAAAPGALSQVIIVATQNQADVRGIVIVQSVRVVILATAIPITLAALGLAGSPPVIVPVEVDNPLPEYALLVVVSTAASLALEWVRFRGGLMFGAMLASALLHGTGVVHVLMPWWIAAIAMCGLGAITGSRFANTGMRLLLNYIGAAFGSFIVAVGVAAIFALGLVAATNFRAADVIVSFSPGALDVMMILALALHLDPIYVGAHHLARFLLISVSLPLATRVVRDRSGGNP